MNTKKLDFSVLAWFAALAVVLLVLFGVTAWRDNNREWMQVQRRYADLQEGRYEKERLAAEAAGKPAPERRAIDALAIKQVIATDLNRVDRCTTCHVSIDDKSFATAAQPFTTHPDLDLITVSHPTEKFGCTSCHHGQGMATSTEAAHGFVHKWDYPMLGDRKDLTKYVQASCAQCHTDPTKWAAIGAPKLARGRQIVEEKNCAACHKFGDVGGAIGPELTFEGDKVPEQFSFAHLQDSLHEGVFGEEAKHEHVHHDVETWHKYHFKNPAAVSSGSIMPAYGFSDEDIEALITYMFSLQKRTAPAHMLTNDAKRAAVAIPAPAPKAAAAPVAAAPAKAMSEADLKANGEKVYAANCASCHQANGQGMPGMFPPIAGAEQVNGDPKEHINIVLKGLSGPITVKGQQYNGAMPGFSQLSDEDIASVLTYERMSWGNKGSVVTPEMVKAQR